MKKVGIWIDKKEAKVVSFEAGNTHLYTIISDIESFHPSGGSGTKWKGGPQDVVLDSKYLEREKHQLTEFFRKVVTYTSGADAVVIFGPAQTGKKLHNELFERYVQFHDMSISIKKADNMTDNQIIAWVRDYYNSDN